MFSFASNDQDESAGISESKILKVTPIFNTKNHLEFLLQKEKRFFKFMDTELQFYIDLPANYVPDNDIGAKLFENIDINLNWESISRKSTAHDYSLSSHFFCKANYDENFINSSYAANGIFDPVSEDAGPTLQKLRRTDKGESVHKIIKIDGEDYKVPFRRYYVTTNINHGLAREVDVLPANITINLRFHRASAECAILLLDSQLDVIKLSDNSKKKIPYKYNEPVIPISNPVLAAYYAFSPELESTMNRVRNSTMEIDYTGDKLNHFSEV